MSHQILLIVFLLSFPLLIMRAEGRSKVIRWISPIIVCYLVGITIGNISADILFSGAYFLFLLTAVKRIMGRFLPAYKQGQNGSLAEGTIQVSMERTATLVQILADLWQACRTPGDIDYHDPGNGPWPHFKINHDEKR